MVLPASSLLFVQPRVLFFFFFVRKKNYRFTGSTKYLVDSLLFPLVIFLVTTLLLVRVVYSKCLFFFLSIGIMNCGNSIAPSSAICLDCFYIYCLRYPAT